MPMNVELLRVLLIEDNLGDGELVRQALLDSQRPYELKQAFDLSSALELLDEWSPEVALVDLCLKDSRGLETLASVHDWAPELPIVVLTGLNDEQNALAALDNGAQDYLVKGEFTPQLLDRSIRYSLQRQRLATENLRMLDQLAAAQSSLEQKNRRLAEMYDTAHQFVDNVSHEFRSPLTVVKEFNWIVRNGLAGPVTPKQIEFLDIVARRIDDLALLVDDLLDMGRIEAGILGVRRKECHLDDICQEAWPQLEQKAEYKNIVLELAVPHELPSAYCDPEKIGRVLVNLAINAVKFTPDHGKVMIWARTAEKPGYLQIGVTDSGPGMDPQTLQLVFERFHQNLAGRRAGIKGFGLGLSIAKELVQLNLGEMFVESTPGAGSTFAFSVPIADPVGIATMMLERCAADGRPPQWMSLVLVQMDVLALDSFAHEIDFLLHDALRGHDLVFGLDPRRWLLVVRGQESEVEEFKNRVGRMWNESNSNQPEEFFEVDIQRLGSWKIGEQDDLLLASLQAQGAASEPAGV
jgi:signal transduction histidine kinase